MLLVNYKQCITYNIKILKIITVSFRWRGIANLYTPDHKKLSRETYTGAMEHLHPDQEDSTKFLFMKPL